MHESFSEQDFEELKGGNLKLLDKLYVSNYQYVLGMLIYRHGASKEDAEDVFMDSMLKFQTAVSNNKVAWGNMRAYLTKIAINLLKERQKRVYSLAQKTEDALRNFYQEKEDINFDKLIEQESEQEEEQSNRKKIIALQWAWEQLGDVCKELLNDTIVNGLKPRFLVEKFEFKNARVITDKKMRCKKKLLDLTENKLLHLN